ncbi:hypothetical protein [Flavobacterium sp.]|uniref:hypothetical protein n=1 Tax=Flavobacterium sp. TaxID=239 RepID=UPI003BCD33F5
MITDIWSNEYFENLTPEQLQQFNALVLKDIKNETSQEESSILLSNINLWIFQLRIIRKDVEFQLASQKAKDKIKNIQLTDDNKSEIDQHFLESNKWRMGAIRFLTAIEHRMLYVKLILTETNQQVISQIES